VRRPLIKDDENWLDCGQLAEIGLRFLDWDFWEAVQRRGGGVNIPEIGSRDGVLCLGGIFGNHADLRRELYWGNFKLVFLRFCSWLHVAPGRRGDRQCDLGEFYWGTTLRCDWGDLVPCEWWGFTKNSRYWRGDWYSLRV
jgi:hypothetical protein